MTGRGTAGQDWARSGKKWHEVAYPSVMTFRGQYTHAIDAKGRTSLPARYRESLAGAGEEKLILVQGLTSAHLLAYPTVEWSEVEQKLGALPQLNPKVRSMLRLLESSAIECPLDGMGRILVPTSHRAYAGLQREIVWAGTGKQIEIWSPDRWQAECEAGRKKLADGELNKLLEELPL